MVTGVGAARYVNSNSDLPVCISQVPSHIQTVTGLGGTDKTSHFRWLVMWSLTLTTHMNLDMHHHHCNLFVFHFLSGLDHIYFFGYLQLTLNAVPDILNHFSHPVPTDYQSCKIQVYYMTKSHGWYICSRYISLIESHQIRNIFWYMDPEMSHKNDNVCVRAAKYILWVKCSKDIFLVGGP